MTVSASRTSRRGRCALALFAALAATLTVGCRTARPRLAPGPGVYSCPAAVTITDRQHRAEIFYTTDGSPATPSSPRYTGSFLVADTATVRAVARAEHEKTSRERAALFTCRPAVNLADLALLLQQSLNLPPPRRLLAFADLHSGDPIFPAAQALVPFLNRPALCPGCQLSANFLPGKPTTRAEAAVVLVSVLVAADKLKLLDAASSNGVLAGVSDAGALPLAARPFLATALQAGILTLDAGNALEPNQPYTHAELTGALNTIQTHFGTLAVPAL